MFLIKKNGTNVFYAPGKTCRGLSNSTIYTLLHNGFVRVVWHDVFFIDLR